MAGRKQSLYEAGEGTVVSLSILCGEGMRNTKLSMLLHIKYWHHRGGAVVLTVVHPPCDSELGWPMLATPTSNLMHQLARDESNHTS